MAAFKITSGTVTLNLRLGVASRASQPVPYLVCPETFEPDQRVVKLCKLAGVDPADLLHRGDMLVIEAGDDIVDVLALLGQADSHGAAVDARALRYTIS
jgi:hypothetical protein